MYRIIGADGKAYGPVSEEQIRFWIAESRVNAQTQVQAEGTAEWKPLAHFPEFSASFAGPEAPIAPSIPAAQLASNREAAKRSVKAPAIALKVYAGLLLVVSLLSLLLVVLVMTGSNPFTNVENAEISKSLTQQFGSATAFIGPILNLVFVGLIFVGASKFERFESFGMALTACILAMLPCSLCCVIGLPIGIWGIVVLNQSQVKSQFK
ncbi:MAG TPA: DUF4339 domain-containing protein [Verrucomicrobiae bacterium]|nr:DUF4339 domain-containing protein [Verrucomicrobiae bacterium]